MSLLLQSIYKFHSYRFFLLSQGKIPKLLPDQGFFQEHRRQI